MGTPTVDPAEPAGTPSPQAAQDRSTEQDRVEETDQPQAEHNGLDKESRSNASTASNEA